MKAGRLITQSEKVALVKKIKGRMDSFETRTLGGRCATPGFKVRSGGRGRGLGVGRGFGPVGRHRWDW